MRISNDLKDLDRRDTAKVVSSIECLKLVLPLLVRKYKEEAAWTTPPAPPYTYYWDILRHACQLIKPTSYSDPEWCTIGSVAIPHLAQVFAVYSELHNTKSLTMEDEALSQCTDENMKQYFQWVQSVQEFIRQWQDKIVTNDWTQTELLNYANIQVSLSKIAKALFIETTVDAEHTEELKKRMASLCDSVESLLVRGSKETERYVSLYDITLYFMYCHRYTGIQYVLYMYVCTIHLMLYHSCHRVCNTVKPLYSDTQWDLTKSSD